MNDDQFKSLIAAADVALPLRAPTPMELAGSVRVLYRRQRRRRLAAAATALVASGVALWLGLANRQHGELANVLPQFTIAAPVLTVRRDDNLDEINQQIEREETLVAALLTAERRQRIAGILVSSSAGFDQRLLPDDQVGQAAMAVLWSADLRAKHLDGIPAARDDYAYLMRALPETVWAARAEERLAALSP